VTPERRAHLVKARARALGFDTAGITDLSPVPHGEALTEWLAAGMAATMAYMGRQASRRREPSRILDGASRAVVVTRNYYNADTPSRPGHGHVAKYARGRDYHAALKGPLEQLAEYIVSLSDRDTLARAYVDAGPVPERELAQRAGLGWIGKNTMLIDPGRGSFLFLASVLTDLDLALDQPFEADRCGSCTRCIQACPTDAFPSDRVLDSRRCISYLTIEHRGDVDLELHPAMGDRIFGCDVCQDVCPWNQKFARADRDPELGQDDTLEWLALDSLGRMSDSVFEERYGAAPLARPGASGIRRNAEIAAQNEGREAAWPTPPTV